MGTYSTEFDLQDRILAIGEDYCGHVQIFARLSPEGLQGVHAAAVCLQINHLPIWACNCRTGCRGHAVTDGATGKH